MHDVWGCASAVGIVMCCASSRTTSLICDSQPRNFLWVADHRLIVAIHCLPWLPHLIVQFDSSPLGGQASRRCDSPPEETASPVTIGSQACSLSSSPQTSCVAYIHTSSPCGQRRPVLAQP
eukprot:15029838-Heterocapsa_arctica.AAC.1